MNSNCRIAPLLVMGLVLGCGRPASPPPAGDKPTNISPPVAARDKTEKSGGHSHDGWWCDEHGVPEEICGQCDPKLAAEFQKKGDWCKEHDRPDSQCFLCHPELEAKFAARYTAKFGTTPPKPQ